MLYDDKPARIATPGTFSFASSIGARYTVGREHVVDALKDVFRNTRELAADIETYGLGLDGLRPKAVAFSDHEHAVVFDPRDEAQEWAIRHAFAHATKLTFHKSPFDVPTLYLNGLMSLSDVAKVEDTLIWSRLATPGERVRKSLLEACNRHLETNGTDVLLSAFKALGLSKKDGFHKFDLDRPIYVQGAASDPLLTYRLAPVVRAAAYAKLTEGHPFSTWGVTGDEAWRLVEREQRINRILLRRTCIGFLVDFEYLDRFKADNAVAVREAEAALAEHGIRPGVGPDLMKKLEELGEVPADHPRTGKTHALSTRAEHLEGLSHPLARMFVEHKKIHKVQNDYLVKVVELADANGRIHPRVNLLAAATGRASMDGVPLQQFPGAARGIILAERGRSFTSSDWSQIEPVTMANIAGDRKVLSGYESGERDVYTGLGELAGISRKQAKTTLLALMYGEGLPKLSASLGLDPGPLTPAEDWEIRFGLAAPGEYTLKYHAAKAIRSAVFRAMPQSAELIKKLKGIAREHRTVFTASGRILDIPVSKGRVEVHKGVNYFCQGGAYDVLAEATIAVEEAGLADALHLWMHDEMIVDTEAADDVQKVMETPPARLCELAGRTPVLRTDRADLGERWAAA